MSTTTEPAAPKPGPKKSAAGSAATPPNGTPAATQPNGKPTATTTPKTPPAPEPAAAPGASDGPLPAPQTHQGTTPSAPKPSALAPKPGAPRPVVSATTATTATTATAAAAPGPAAPAAAATNSAGTPAPGSAPASSPTSATATPVPSTPPAALGSPVPSDTTDFYGMEDFTSDRAKELRSRIRTFVDNDLLPIINDYWERADFPAQLLPKIAAIGAVGGTIKGYGCPGLTPLEAGIAAAEFARGDGSINTAIGVHSGLAMGAIGQLGSEEQKQRWLPRMAQMDLIGCFALTEPTHGSDSVALETSARREGDHYVINGAKRWIGNATFADIVVLWARDEADGKVKGFVMEKDANGEHPQGYDPTLITGKIGKRAVWQPDIRITDVRIPVENKLVNANSFADVNLVLAATRGGVAWESLGHAMATYEYAVEYAKTREQFGKPIASFQLVQYKLALMLSELTSIQLMCVRMAQLQEQGRLTGPHASLAKLHTAQKARWIAREARDIMGGNGLLLENHVARHLTDMEVVHTYEGTENMQALILGRTITGISAFA